MKHKALIFTFLSITFFLFATGALAQYDYTPMENIPGTTEDISAFPDYVKAIYKFTIWSVGIAALLMVSVGGFMYFSAAGNTSKLDKAKIVIRDSIFGIGAVLTAYLLLYTINPDLVGVSLSGLSNLNNSNNSSVSFQPASPSQGTINSPFTTRINITGSGSYTLESLIISGIDEGNYTSSLNSNTIAISVPSSQLELGTYQVTATIIDQNDNSHTSENLNFRIISDSSQLAVTTLGLNEGIVGKDYSQLIQAEGGAGSYTIAVSGLPNNLTFNSGANTITGTPTQVGTYPITITVNDGTNDPIEKEFSLSVREGDYPVLPPDCVSVCQDGDTKCTITEDLSKSGIQYCELHNTCWVWGSPHSCPEGQSCSNNICQIGSAVNPNVDESDVTTLESGHIGYYTLSAGETRYFKIVSDVPDCQHPIQVGNTPQSQEPPTVRMIIKRGSKPIISDYDILRQLGSSVYDCGDERYYPAKPASVKDYFWRFNTGSSGEFVEIFEPMETDAFYIMLYNSGTESVGSQRLTIYYNQ